MNKEALAALWDIKETCGRRTTCDGSHGNGVCPYFDDRNVRVNCCGVISPQIPADWNLMPLEDEGTYSV